MKPAKIKCFLSMFFIGLMILLSSQCKKDEVEVPKEQDTLAKYKNYIHVKLNDKNYFFDDIVISSENGASPGGFFNGYIFSAKLKKDTFGLSTFGLSVVLYPHKEAHTPGNANSIFTIGYYDDVLVALMGETTNILFFKHDTQKHSYSTKFTVDYDDKQFGKGHIDCEFYNVDSMVWKFPQTFDLDTLRNYGIANRKWYYVGETKKGELSNFTRPLNVTAGPLRLFFEKEEVPDYMQLPYNYFCNAYGGNYHFLGTWEPIPKGLIMEYNRKGITIDYEWDTEDIQFFDSLFTSGKLELEKEYNILKMYFDNRKRSLIFYAKPEEYGDTIFNKKRIYNLNHKKNEKETIFSRLPFFSR